jgi:hypothetical protein
MTQPIADKDLLARDFDIDKHAAPLSLEIVDFAELKCVLCWKLPTDALSMKCCRATLCTPCVKKSGFVDKTDGTSDGPCPKCRAMSYVMADRTKSKMCSEIKVKCPRDGCSWINMQRDWLAHVNDCEHRLVACPNHNKGRAQVNTKDDGKGCPKILKAVDIAVHLTSCEFRPMVCPACQQQVVSCDYAMHVGTWCDKRPVPCKKCNMVVKADQLMNHDIFDCIYENCPVCDGWFHRGKQKEHITNPELSEKHIKGLPRYIERHEYCLRQREEETAIADAFELKVGQLLALKGPAYASKEKKSIRDAARKRFRDAEVEQEKQKKPKVGWY